MQNGINCTFIPTAEICIRPEGHFSIYRLWPCLENALCGGTRKEKQMMRSDVSHKKTAALCVLAYGSLPEKAG
jgi:hypothetical protein